MFVLFIKSEVSFYEFLFVYVGDVILAVGMLGIQEKKTEVGNDGPCYSIDFHWVFYSLLI